MDWAGDDGAAFVLAALAEGDHVDLAADAELARKVEAGFDRETGVG